MEEDAVEDGNKNGQRKHDELHIVRLCELQGANVGDGQHKVGQATTKCVFEPRDSKWLALARQAVVISGALSAAAAGPGDGQQGGGYGNEGEERDGGKGGDQKGQVEGGDVGVRLKGSCVWM